jgi:hypothetical protein
MFDRSFRKAWLLLLFCFATMASADAGGPRAGFKPHPEDTFVSPDETIRLKQFSKVISLSFDMQGEEVKTPWIEDWHCVYDLKTGAFSVPAEFAEHNLKAITYPEPKSI